MIGQNHYSVEQKKGFVAQVLKGFSVTDLATRIDVSRRAVYDWVHAYGQQIDTEVLRQVAVNARRFKYQDKGLFGPIKQAFMDIVNQRSDREDSLYKRQCEAQISMAQNRPQIRSLTEHLKALQESCRPIVQRSRRSYSPPQPHLSPINQEPFNPHPRQQNLRPRLMFPVLRIDQIFERENSFLERQSFHRNNRR